MLKYFDSVNFDQLKDQVKSQADKLLKKTLNRHIKLAVTGLSRSGKSAFITSLVYQLCEQSNGSNLPFVESISQSRFIGAKKIPQTSLHIPSFGFQEALDSLFGDEPTWPESTRSISELRLAIRYRPEEGLLSQLSEYNTLYVDIIDYPGEWLMDLPMLSMDFAKWSGLMADLFQREPRKSTAQAFIERVNQLDLQAPVDEPLLESLSRQYSALLLKFKNEMGLSLLQPGRFILPGELEGAPILQFIPAFKDLKGIDWENLEPGTNLAALVNRFDEYKNHVVKAFYNDHFKHFDRQIVLVDCLAPLNAGSESFAELQRSLALILQSYHYGKNDLLHRLFSPQIDKLLFAASKADHITTEQHKNLTLLLNKLVEQSRKDIQFEGIEVETMSMSSIKATENGFIEHEGETFPCIKGTTFTENERKKVTLFPGEIPREIPKSAYWLDNQFNFVSFEPAKNPDQDSKVLEHIRMDHVIEYLLGDKLR
ncbi:MAG: putative YcjX-like family ATPase [Phenylobacterium sp.]|jgi:predicted YcjX-like family ATPase